MPVKFLRDIIEELINRPSAPIIELLFEKKDVNEFLIAKKLELTINQTRNILYKLSDYGLVSFIRKKDKRKGWYIYFWTLNVYQALSLLEKKLKEELEELEFQLRNRKQKRHYLCKTCSIEVTEEAALLNDFTCSECEEVYELSEDQIIVNQLEKKIAKVQKEIKLVSYKKSEEEAKLEKKKSIKIKRLRTRRKSENRIKRNLRKEEKLQETIKQEKIQKRKEKLKKSFKKKFNKIKKTSKNLLKKRFSKLLNKK